LSARYSNSHSLRLVIARSRIYRVLHRAWCLLSMAALYRLGQRGYPLLALMLAPVAIVCCWQTARQTLAGCVLSWNAGQWFISRGARAMPVTVERNTSLPRVIYLAWIDPADSARGSALLFADSMPESDLRRLRVRLALQR